MYLPRLRSWIGHIWFQLVTVVILILIIGLFVSVPLWGCILIGAAHGTLFSFFYPKEKKQLPIRIDGILA